MSLHPVAGNWLSDGQAEAEASEPSPVEKQQHRRHLGQLTASKDGAAIKMEEEEK